MKITMQHAEGCVMDILRAGLVANLISSPGIGKSALAKQIAEKQKLKLIDVRLSQMDPADLNGFPFIINKDTPENTRAGYVPMNIFPIASDPVPEGYEGWLVLMDEFPSAPLNVQAAAYKIVLDKMVGMHHLHSKVAIITAGNLSTDKAIVNRLSTAMQSRVVTLEIIVCDKAWGIWADKHDVDHRVKSFIKFKPALLHKFDPNHSEHTFPCPRTWEFMSKIIKPIKEIGITRLPVLAGTVGEGTAREFHSYCMIFGDLPTLTDILRDPENVHFGDEPSIHYALSGLVGHHINPTNVNDLVKFVKRLGIDFQVVTLRAAIAKNSDIRKASGIKNWIVHNAEEYLG